MLLRATALGAALTGLLAGCQTTGTTGRSLVAEELARLETNALFRVEEVDPELAYVTADGARVAIRPVEGLCLTSESIELTESGVFAVIADCLTETDPERSGRTEKGETVYRLPPPFPGLMTLSVSAEPMFDRPGDRDGALDEMERFLASPEGLALLGRNGSPDKVEMVEAKRLGDALYVHVKDGATGGLPLLAPEFWRAFVEVRGRLVLVTVSGFRDRPLDDGVMLAVLAAQVARLREANEAPEVAREVELAESVADYLNGRAAQIVVAGEIAPISPPRNRVATTYAAPDSADAPPTRTVPGLGRVTIRERGRGGGTAAPDTAPSAASRP